MIQQWYALHTYSGHENKVKSYLESIIESGLADAVRARLESFIIAEDVEVADVAPTDQPVGFPPRCPAARWCADITARYAPTRFFAEKSAPRHRPFAARASAQNKIQTANTATTAA